MDPLRLFHVSEDAGIRLFVPRPDPVPGTGIEGEAVWAVDKAHLPNRLLPYDCPRVTFCASHTTSASDREKFLTGATAKRVIAVETKWYPIIQACKLTIYEFRKRDADPTSSAASRVGMMRGDEHRSI